MRINQIRCDLCDKAVPIVGPRLPEEWISFDDNDVCPECVHTIVSLLPPERRGM